MNQKLIKGYLKHYVEGVADIIVHVDQTFFCYQFYYITLKMLGLYLYTLRIGHKSGNMLSILNKLTLQKELHISVTNNVFFDKKVKTQQQ